MTYNLTKAQINKLINYDPTIEGGSLKSQFISNIIYSDKFNQSLMKDKTKSKFIKKLQAKKQEKTIIDDDKDEIDQIKKAFKDALTDFKKIKFPKQKDERNYLDAVMPYVKETYKKHFEEINKYKEGLMDKYIESDKLTIKELVDKHFYSDKITPASTTINRRAIKIILEYSSPKVKDFYNEYINLLKNENPEIVQNTGDKELNKNKIKLKEIFDEIYSGRPITRNRFTTLSKNIKKITADNKMHPYYNSLVKEYNENR